MMTIQVLPIARLQPPAPHAETVRAVDEVSFEATLADAGSRATSRTANEQSHDARPSQEPADSTDAVDRAEVSEGQSAVTEDAPRAEDGDEAASPAETVEQSATTENADADNDARSDDEPSEPEVTVATLVTGVDIQPSDTFVVQDGQTPAPQVAAQLQPDIEPQHDQTRNEQVNDSSRAGEAPQGNLQVTNAAQSVAENTQATPVLIGEAAASTVTTTVVDNTKQQAQSLTADGQPKIDTPQQQAIVAFDQSGAGSTGGDQSTSGNGGQQTDSEAPTSPAGFAGQSTAAPTAPTHAVDSATSTTALANAGSVESPTAPMTGQTQAAQAVQVPLANLDLGDDPVNLARVARGLRGAINQNGGVVTLRLHPPEMGFVRIQMHLDNGTVNATLHSDNASVRTLLTQQLAQLRQSLESQGLNVERLQVQTLSQSNNASTTAQRDESFGQHADGRSRGQYTAQRGGANVPGEGDESSPQPEDFEQALGNTVT